MGSKPKTGPRTYTGYSGVDVYRLGRSGRWRDVTGRWPQHETVNTPVFTGARILLGPSQIWCGACMPPMQFDTHGYLVNPTTLKVTALPHGPIDDAGPQIIWTGNAELALNQSTIIGGPENVHPGDIAIYSPRTRRWTRGPRAPKQLDGAPAVWTGQQLLALAQDGQLLAYGK